MVRAGLLMLSMYHDFMIEWTVYSTAILPLFYGACNIRVSCFIAVHKTCLSMFYAFKFRLMMTMIYCSLLLLRWGRGVVVAVALSSPVAPGMSLSQPTVPPVTAGLAPWRFPGFCLCVCSVLYVYIYIYIYHQSMTSPYYKQQLLFLVSCIDFK